MTNRKSKAYPNDLKTLMAEKSRALSQAESIAQMGLEETARPLWAAAGKHEERIAPRLDALGRDDEAAVHRISAASCYEKARQPSRAANLYRAALAGPLSQDVAADILTRISVCLKQLKSETVETVF